MATPIHTRTIDSIQITNDYQDTNEIILDPINNINCRRLLRTWRIDAGRDQTLDPVTELPSNSRIRDTYAKVTLKFINDERHHTLVLHDLVSLYMVPAESIANKSQK